MSIFDLEKNNNFNIIDIRDKNSYINGHISGAININYFDLLNNPNNYLSKDKIYYIYCSSGFRSKGIVKQLNMLGYNCVNIDGGYNLYLLGK